MKLKVSLFIVIVVVLTFFVVLQTGALNAISRVQVLGVPFAMLAVLLGFIFFVSACWIAGRATANDEEGGQ